MNVEHELIFNHPSQKPTQNKTLGVNTKKLCTGKLNENVTTKDIYKILQLKSTAYLR